MGLRDVSAYSRAQAIVRARYSTLLDDEEWAGLIECRDYGALVSLLAKSVYAPHLQIAIELLTPRRTVYQLRWRLAGDYETLIDVVPDPGRQVIMSLWQSYEIDNLKAALRGVETGASWDQVRHLLSPMGRSVSLKMTDLERMVRSGSVERAVDRTVDTPYYDTLIHALERYRREHNLFPLEVALDLDHRRGLWASVQRLSGRDATEAQRLIGTVLDRDNLLWALRYRLYHHLSEQEIVNYTLPFGYRVHDEDIRAIAAGDDVRQIVLRLYPELGELEEIDDPAGGRLTLLEQHLWAQLMEMCRGVFSGNPFHIGLPIAYLLLRENEIRNLTTVVEAKASDLPAEAIRPLLVR
jgi:vacuolar-type H+-ATPase subunit C/Vma6